MTVAHPTSPVSPVSPVKKRKPRSVFAAALAVVALASESAVPDADPVEEGDCWVETGEVARQLLDYEDKEGSSSKVAAMQAFLSTFEYSVDGPSFRARKQQSLMHILAMAQDIIRARRFYAIQCLEASFVALYLTQGMGDLCRFGISFESLLPDDRKYYHQVVGVMRIDEETQRPVFGAFGMSRDWGLGNKPLAFPSLVSLIRNYRWHYRRAGHLPLSCKIGRPFAQGPCRHRRDTAGMDRVWRLSGVQHSPVWTQSCFYFQQRGWVAAMAKYEKRLLSSTTLWPDPVPPYRRERGDETILVAEHRPRVHPPTSDGQTPPDSDLESSPRGEPFQHINEYVRRICQGEFRHSVPGRPTFQSCKRAVVLVQCFARTRLAALRVKCHTPEQNDEQNEEQGEEQDRHAVVWCPLPPDFVASPGSLRSACLVTFDGADPPPFPTLQPATFPPPQGMLQYLVARARGWWKTVAAVSFPTPFVVAGVDVATNASQVSVAVGGTAVAAGPTDDGVGVCDLHPAPVTRVELTLVSSAPLAPILVHRMSISLRSPPTPPADDASMTDPLLPFERPPESPSCFTCCWTAE
eukprot:Sspe_Gene.58818::Locus_32294_Transcript_1_1_Confidence_1.000_Length_1979::g.58818::m.58818